MIIVAWLSPLGDLMRNNCILSLLLSVFVMTEASAKRFSPTSEIVFGAYREICLESFDVPLVTYIGGRPFPTDELNESLTRNLDLGAALRRGASTFWLGVGHDIYLADPAPLKGRETRGRCQLKSAVRDADNLREAIIDEAARRPESFQSYYSGDNLTGEGSRDVLCASVDGKARILLLTVGKRKLARRDPRRLVIIDAIEAPGSCDDELAKLIVAIPGSARR